MLNTSLRSHACGELRPAHIGEKVTLAGWVHSRRHHGGLLFIDLRDRTGIIQLVADPADAGTFQTAESLRSEFSIQVKGAVRGRPAATENPRLSTGAVEVLAETIAVLNPSKPIPFEISDYVNVSEELRLKYRYLDLRRSKPLQNMLTRHRLAQAARDFLNAEQFIEVETPILTKSTPEGARDFLVPSRLSPGNYYALPQSPQMFKQILMVAGIERYYQFARAFRDEDLRADRQPEFTQIDLEMSYATEEDVHAAVEGMTAAIFAAMPGLTLPRPFASLSYQEVFARYGSDKPDMRFGLPIHDCTAIFRASGFKIFRQAVDGGGVVRFLKGAERLSRQEIDRLQAKAKEAGAQGLAWLIW